MRVTLGHTTTTNQKFPTSVKVMRTWRKVETMIHEPKVLDDYDHYLF